MALYTKHLTDRFSKSKEQIELESRLFDWHGYVIQAFMGRSHFDLDKRQGLYPAQFLSQLQYGLDYYGYVKQGNEYLFKIGNFIMIPISDKRGWSGMQLKNPDEVPVIYPDFPIAIITGRIAEPGDSNFMGIDILDGLGNIIIKIGSILKDNTATYTDQIIYTIVQTIESQIAETKRLTKVIEDYE